MCLSFLCSSLTSWTTRQHFRISQLYPFLEKGYIDTTVKILTSYRSFQANSKAVYCIKGKAVYHQYLCLQMYKISFQWHKSYKHLMSRIPFPHADAHTLKITLLIILVMFHCGRAGKKDNIISFLLLKKFNYILNIW